jgi:hypothetical protein
VRIQQKVCNPLNDEPDLFAARAPICELLVRLEFREVSQKILRYSRNPGTWKHAEWRRATKTAITADPLDIPNSLARS